MKPILFNTRMVEAILEGRKTVTRRIIKPQPTGQVCHYTGFNTDYWGEEVELPSGKHQIKLKPPYSPGDILYVRETWSKGPDGSYSYRADNDTTNQLWKPSIHMPKTAARLFLKVISVRAERLQDMLSCPGEVAKEGIPYADEGDREASGLRFKELWDSTIKSQDLAQYGWNANPWVWVIEFEIADKIKI